MLEEMLTGVKRYVKMNPVAAITDTLVYGVSAWVVGSNLYPFLSKGEIDLSDGIRLAIGGLLAILRTTDVIDTNRKTCDFYESVYRKIETRGFTSSVLCDSNSRKAAKFYAEEHGRLWEYDLRVKELLGANN